MISWPTHISAPPLPVSTEASTPSSFGLADWLIRDDSTGGDATLTLLALPFNGGSPVQIIQYSVAGGPWQPIPGSNSTGVYPLMDVFTDGVATQIVLRAVNAQGPGPASDPKYITTTSGGGLVWAFTGTTLTTLPTTAGWSFTGTTVTTIGDV